MCTQRELRDGRLGKFFVTFSPGDAVKVVKVNNRAIRDRRAKLASELSRRA